VKHEWVDGEQTVKWVCSCGKKMAPENWQAHVSEAKKTEKKKRKPTERMR
jgi:hypothetical protein